MALKELDTEDSKDDQDEHHNDKGVGDGHQRRGERIDERAQRAQLIEKPQDAKRAHQPQDGDAWQVAQEQARQ